MFIRRVIILLFLVASFHYSGYSQWKLFSVIDTIPIKKSVNEKRLFKDMFKWFEDEKRVKPVRSNPNSFVIEGKGFFVYYNHIIIENIFLSPRAAERTTGSIAYSIRASIRDSIVVVEFRNFKHEAYYNQYGMISFGSITDYESVPPGRCMENEVWCNAVWSEMKEAAKAEVLEKSSRIVPQMNIRKEGKIFDKEEEEESDTVEVDKGNEDYLNLDNYLLKE